MRSILLAVWCALPTAPAQAQELEAWARKYKIDLVVDPTRLYPLATNSGKITGTKSDPKEVRRYEELTFAEVRKYPSDFVRKLGLKKIVMAKELKLAGQKRAAIPDFDHGFLHLDPEEGSHLEIYQRTVIHHEIFHIVDLKDDGELYEDRAWKKLNPRDFKYGSGGKNARTGDQWSLDDSLVGFLNMYSMSGVEEDKAEIYSNLLVRTGIVRRRGEKDAGVAEKVKRMKQLLRSFSKEMDDEFWDSLEK